MGKSKVVFSALLCGITVCMPAVAAPDCDNAIYRRYNPDKCAGKVTTSDSKMSFGTTATITGGALAIAGGALALLGSSSSGSSSASGASAASAPLNKYNHPTLHTYQFVGADVDEITLAHATNGTEYARNQNQYNDIRLAYSLARGYTGATSTIAVLDTGANAWHGRNVAYLASGSVAPNANVVSYDITDTNGDFVSYAAIGDIISNAAKANTNIYNLSWSANKYANQVHTRQQIEHITDPHFVTQITNAAKTNDAIFVWAAGNDGHTESSTFSALPNVVPELQGHFINVVAWDSTTGALADFSNACGVTMNYCITAPGAALESPKSSILLDGTSFAAPIVSAAVAVLREAFPYMQSGDITKLLFATARDLGDTGIDAIYGHGLLDMERATRPVGAATVPVSDTVSVPLRTAHISAPIGTKIKSADINFAFVDSFGRAFSTPMNHNISIKNRSIALDRLTDKSTSTQISNVRFGFKPNNLLSGTGFLQTQSDNSMTFLEISDNHNIGDLNIFYSATLGTDSPHASPESIITGFSNIYTAAAHLGVTHGDWTLQIGTPDTIISGNMYLRTLSGRAPNGEYTYTNHTINLASIPSVEYVLSYRFMTAGFVDNPYGTDEIYMLAKTKISF